MKPKWWQFSFLDDMFILRTPWFGFIWNEYSKDILSYSWIRGFDVHWGQNKNIKEGDSYYLYSKRFILDRLPVIDTF